MTANVPRTPRQGPPTAILPCVDGRMSGLGTPHTATQIIHVTPPGDPFRRPFWETLSIRPEFLARKGWVQRRGVALGRGKVLCYPGRQDEGPKWTVVLKATMAKTNMAKVMATIDGRKLCATTGEGVRVLSAAAQRVRSCLTRRAPAWRARGVTTKRTAWAFLALRPSFEA